MDGPTTATISVYAQSKGTHFFSSRTNKQEICLGRETIKVSLHPKSKTTERFVLNSDPKAGQSNDFQLLVVHGTYISRRTQNMLNNTILFEDFITAYVRTSMVPVSVLCIKYASIFNIFIIRDGIDSGVYCVEFNSNYMISSTKR